MSHLSGFISQENKMLLLVFWFLLFSSSSTQSKRKLGFFGDVIFQDCRADLSYRIFS